METLKSKTTFNFRGSLIATLLSITVAFGQSNSFSQKYGTEEDYHRLKFLNIQYVQSYVKADSATYNRLLWAEDWIHQNSSDGGLYTKKQLLPIFGTPRFETMEYFYPDNVIIQFITNDAAMIYSQTPGRDKGEAVNRLSQYNDVYIRRNGRWVCVSANIASVKRPGDKPANFVKVAELPQLKSYLPGTEEDKKILKEINDKHAEAFATSKSELLENILAEDFTLLASNGLLYKKKEVLDQVKASAKDNNVASYKIENMFTRFVAADVAMIHAAIISTLKDGSKRGTQYNDIYVKRNNTWICVSGNNTSINSAK